jgi:hypothetical protein
MGGLSGHSRFLGMISATGGHGLKYVVRHRHTASRAIIPIFVSLGGILVILSLPGNLLGQDKMQRLRVRRDQIREILPGAYFRVVDAIADLLPQYGLQILMADLCPQRLEGGVVLQKLPDLLLFQAFALDFFKDWSEADVGSALIIQ